MTDQVAVQDMVSLQTNAIATWNALPPGSKTTKKWKDIFMLLFQNQTNKLQAADHGDPTTADIPPPP